MTPFETVGSRIAYQGVLSNVRIDELRGADGRTFRREVVEHVDAVAVVPVTDADEVVLVRQYRHAVGAWLDEIPAGIRDVTGEAEVDTAARELVEEVGLAAAALEPLTTIHTSAGWSDEATTIFLGTGLSEARAPEGFHPSEEEAAMQVVRIPIGAALRAAALCDP